MLLCLYQSCNLKTNSLFESKLRKIKLDAYNISTHRCGSMSTVTKFSGINNFMFTMGFEPLVFSQICKQMDKIFAVGTFILNLSDYSPWNLVTGDITPESSGLEYISLYIIFWYSTWCWHMFWMQVEEPRNAVVQKKNVCAIFWKKTMWIKKWLNQMEKSGRVGCIFCRFYQLQDHQLYYHYNWIQKILSWFAKNHFSFMFNSILVLLKCYKNCMFVCFGMVGEGKPRWVEIKWKARKIQTDIHSWIRRILLLLLWFFGFGPQPFQKNQMKKWGNRKFSEIFRTHWVR